MKHVNTILILTAISLLFSNTSYCQADTIKTITDTKDTVGTSKQKKHSPKLATYLSAALPGAGQCYNKQYWKPPVIYAGTGLLIYSYSFNNTYYKLFKEAYTTMKEGNAPNGIYIEGDYFPTLESLQAGKDQYRKSRDMSVIGMVLLYVLNIIDASVYAHFYDYDVSEDLSFRIEPLYFNTIANKNNPGIKINVYF